MKTDCISRFLLAGLAAVVLSGISANAQTWTFDNSNSVTFIPTGSFGYNPTVPNFRYNYGSAHSSAAFQWSSQDANGNPRSGSIGASLTLNENLDTNAAKGAFVIDLAGGSGINASALSFDLMIAPGSATDQYGGYGDIGIATLTGGWGTFNAVWDGPSPETNYEFGTSFGVPYTAGTWYHFNIPLTGATGTGINAVNIQDYDGGLKIINGTIHFFIDNLALVTKTQTITLQPGMETFVGCQVNGAAGNNINNASFLQMPSQLSFSVEMYLFQCGGGFNYSDPYIWLDSADASPGPAGWYDEIYLNYATNVVWNPGEGMVLVNDSGSPASLTLNGSAPIPVLPPTNYCGCGQWSLFGSQTNSATNTFQMVTGFSPINGAQVAIFTGGSFVTNTYSNGAWTPSVPILTNTQAALFFIPCQTSSPPQITTQPLSQTNYAGTNVSFAVTATGTAPLNYQWKINGTNLTNNGRVLGSQSNILTIVSVLMSDAGNYLVAITNSVGSTNSAPARLAVLKATPLLTWPSPAAITYGTALGASQLNAAPSVPGTNAYTPTTGSVLNAGTNTLSDIFTPNDAIDYNAVTSSVSLVVLRAPLTVTASNVTRPYGQPNPPLPVAIIGLQNGDNITATGTCAATVSSPPNSYPIIPVLSDPGNRFPNYTVATNNGTLMVTCAVIALAPVSLSNAMANLPYSQTLTASGSTGAYSFAIMAGALPAGFSLSSGGMLSGTNVNAGTNTFTISATDQFGCAGSQAYTLISVAPPTISTPPHNRTVFAGSNAVFTVTAGGTGPLNYQWFYNGTPLNNGGQFAGVNSNVVTIVNAQSTNAGGYSVLITNSIGSVTSAVVTLSVILPADLQVVSVSIPQQAWTGRSFDTSWVLTNGGPGVATGPWDDRIYLSTTNQLRTNLDQVIGDFDFEGQLAPGQSVQLIQPVTISSAGVTNGFYYVSVFADVSNNVFEVNKTNNVGVSPSNLFVQVTPQPTLVISSVDAPANGIGGQPVRVSWVVCNQGQANTEVPVWYDHLYLSTTTNLTGKIQDFGEYENPSYLLPGDCYEQDVTVTLPVGISGPFYFIVHADATGQVEEDDITNNFGSTPSPINIQLVTPGFLHVASVQVAPAAPTTVWAGESVTVTWTVENIGQTTIIGRWADTAALSPTQVSDNRNGYPHILGEGVGASGPLQPGQSYTNTSVFIVPQGIATSNWYVVPIVDFTYQAVTGPAAGEVGRDQNSALLVVSTAPPSDLAVTSVSAPATGYASESINVSWVVNNEGLNGTAATSWYDGVYLSKNGVFDINQDLLLANFAHWGSLAVGASYTNNQSVPLPASLLPYGATNATYSLFVYADVFNAVSEITKTNNVLEATNPLTILPAPPPAPADLAVKTVSAPSTILAGGPASVFWTVANLSTSTTSATNWMDSVYLSPDGTFNPSLDILLANIPHNGSLAAGDSYTVAENLNTPYCTMGTYFVVVLTDSGYQVNTSGEVTNNVLASPNPMHILPNNAARLEVSSVSSASSVTAGAPLTVSWTVVNSGNSAANAPWIDGVFLSTKPFALGGNGYLLGTYTNQSKLVSGGSYSPSKSYTVPPCFAGTYYVTVVADLSNVVDSISCDTNNATTASGTVQVLPTAYPNLQIAGLTLPTTITSGVPWTAQWSVTNAGTGAAAGTWFDGVYASLSPMFNANAILLGEFGHNGGLAAHGTYSQSQLVQIPPCTAGQYYIFIATDISNVVNVAACQANNPIRSTNALPVSFGHYPQLAVNSVVVPATANGGQLMAISWAVTNAGLATANSPWVDAVYLSADGTFNPASDPFLGYYTNTTSLAPGASRTESTSFTLPDIYGNVYVAVFADAQFAVFECGNESNRLAVSTTTVNVPRTLYPDLQVTAVQIPANARAGQPFTVTWVVINDGTDTTGATPWNDAVYLSPDEVLDPSDPRLGTFPRVRSLGVGQSYTNSATVVIPPGNAGPFYILVLADSGGVLFEPLGYNDSLGWNPDAILVTLPPPADLAASNVTLAPATGVPGTQATIGWTVSNVSTNDTVSTWTDALYLSTKNFWDITATLVTNVNHTGLAALSHYNGSWAGPLPALTPGSYYAIVRADVRNSVPEPNLSNNVAVSSSAISVDVPVIVLGQIVTNALTTGGAQYYKVNCPAGQTLKVTLTGASTNSFNELYVRFGGVPDLGNYDFIYNNPMAPNQQITIPTTQAGWYYIMVRGGNEPNGPLNYSLAANIVPFAIASVAPTHIGDNGQVTITVNGSQFQPAALVQLVSGTNIYTAATNFFGDPTSVKARFFFTNAVHGAYDVVLTNPGNQSTTAPQAITIETALPLTATVVPGVFNSLPRAGTTFNWVGAVANSGNIDIEYLTVVIGDDQTFPINLTQPAAAAVADSSSGVFIVRDVPPATSLDFSFVISGFGSQGVNYYIVPMCQSKEDFLAGVADDAESAREFLSEPPGEVILTTTNASGVVATNIEPLPSDLTAFLSNTNAWATYYASILANTGLLDSNDLSSLPLPIIAPLNTQLENLALHVNAIPLDISSCLKAAQAKFDAALQAALLAFSICMHNPCGFECIKQRAECQQTKVEAEATAEAKREKDSAACPLTNSPPGKVPCGRPFPFPGGLPGRGFLPGMGIIFSVSSIIGGIADASTGASSSASSGGVCSPSSGDPNAKEGPAGYGTASFVGSQVSWLYTIYFENESNAPAFARQVSITDALDPNLDIRTFRVGNIIVGNTIITVPTNSTYYQTRIALPPPNPPNIVADITASVNVQNRTLSWTMNAIDLGTGQLVTGTQEGVLPPNTTNNIGAGYVTFSIKPAADVPTGTVVTNQASIVFDINDPIPTDTTTNTVDAVPPTSSVATLPSVINSNTFTVYWSGTDDPGGSGVASFNIYFSDNGGPKQVWQAGTTSTSAQFTGQFGHTYAFYSTAQDNSGNVEAAHATPDTTTLVSSPPVIAPVADQTVNVGTGVIITNTVSEADQPAPAIAYSLGPNAPAGAFVNPTNGVFIWTPGCDQGSTTNLIAVNVTASNNPLVTNSILFNVVVGECVQVGVGSTVVQTGQSATVPVNLFTTVGLTNLSFTLVYPTNRFTNWTISATNLAVATDTAQMLGPSNTFFRLTTSGGQVLQGPTEAGSITFSALPGSSAFIPLAVTGVAGTKADGSPAGNISGLPGRVVVIGPQPLLEAWLSTNQQRMLTLYGNPGASYEVDYSTNLSGVNWQYAWRVPMTNLFEAFAANGSLPQVFYRAFEFSANPPILQLNPPAPSNLVLLIYGQKGTNYTIISGTNLLNSASWTSVAGFTLTNSFQFIGVGDETNRVQFFRAKRQ